MVKFLEIINEYFPLEEKEVPEEYKQFSMSGMDHKTEMYYAKGLGNVSYMQTSGMNGAMVMDTIVICPLEKDAKLISYDRIFAMGNDTLIYELYDGNTLLEHTEEKLPTAESEKIDNIVYPKLTYYLEEVKDFPSCDVAVKSAQIDEYALWLLGSGGMATENFIKNIGVEKTKEFFTNVLFSSKIS